MGSLDEVYLRWLFLQIATDRRQVSSTVHWSLMRQLYLKPFVWLIPNDDNRCSDGMALRDQCIEQLDIRDVSPKWLARQCTTLEMLIALAGRIAFEEGGETNEWFWHLLENLGLSTYNPYPEEVDEALERLIWRTYQPNGHGGLFPLRHAEEDQRQVELWYQMNAYLMERDI